MAEYTKHIKANLPRNAEDYENGSGEGCFFLVSERTKEAHDTNESGTVYEGLLDNDSIYYKDLLHGTLLPIEMRGERRPVVPLDYLQANYELAED